MKKILTLTIIYQHPRVLLGMKKKGFGAGRYNGFGGKVEKGESIEKGARREVFEEAGVRPLDMEEVAVIDFEFKDSQESLEVHVFKSTLFEGEPSESEEMKPQWFDISEVPFDTMWPDDRFWFPLFFEGKKFKAQFLFGEGDSILDQRIELTD